MQESDEPLDGFLLACDTRHGDLVTWVLRRDLSVHAIKDGLDHIGISLADVDLNVLDEVFIDIVRILCTRNVHVHPKGDRDLQLVLAKRLTVLHEVVEEGERWTEPVSLKFPA